MGGVYGLIVRRSFIAYAEGDGGDERDDEDERVQNGGVVEEEEDEEVGVRDNPLLIYSSSSHSSLI